MYFAKDVNDGTLSNFYCVIVYGYEQGVKHDVYVWMGVEMKLKTCYDHSEQ